MRNLLCHAFFLVQSIMWNELLSKLAPFLLNLWNVKHVTGQNGAWRLF